MEEVVQDLPETTGVEQPKKKSSFWKKVDAFFDKNYAYFFAPLIVLLLYFFALWQFGVYPFGNTHTAASYDLFAQICPFIEHFFDVFNGESSLSYTYSVMGGLDVTGSILYFFISPFHFLFLIFGEGRIAHASAIVLACKLATIAWAGTWFAKKLFKNIPEYVCVVVGVVYAFCGYTFVSNTYINWMDFLIWAPLAVGAFKRYVKTGKFLRFSLVLAASIYTCFSIACFSMFTVFPALIAYGLFCVKKEEKNKFIAYLCLSFAVAILIALPVLLPALGAYNAGARGGGIFEKLWTGYVVVDKKPVEFNTGSSALTSFMTNYSDSIYRKWTYIFTDGLFIALTLVWFIRKGLKDNFAKWMLACGIFTLLPTIVDEAMNLMNMGSYMSYALRFGFLNALYFMGGACLCLDGVCFKNDHAYDGSFLDGRQLTPWNSDIQLFEKTEKMEKDGGVSASKWKFLKNVEWKKIYWKSYIWTFILGGIALATLGFLLWFIQGDNYQTVIAFFANDESLKKTLDNSGRSLAWSTGALELVIVPSLIVVTLVCFGALLIKLKKISAKWLSIVLIPIVFMQVFFYNMQWVSGGRSTLHVELNQYSALAKEVNALDEEYFRVKDFGIYYKGDKDNLNDDYISSKWTACAPLVGGTNAHSGFSSMMAAENFAVFQLFGYNGNGKNAFHSSFNLGKLQWVNKDGSTTQYANEAFADSFMNYKYVFVSKSQTSRANSKTYLKKVMVKNEAGEEVQLSTKGYCVYENTMVFPLGFRVATTKGYEFVAANENLRVNRRKNQRELYRYLMDMPTITYDTCVTDEMVEALSKDLWTRNADVQVGKAKITANVQNAKAGESLMLSFVASEGYTVKVNGKKAKLIENDLCLIQVALEEGDNEIVLEYSSPYKKHVIVGIAGAIIALCLVAVLVHKTKVVDKCSAVISWAGIALGVGLVVFFMIFPTGVAISKVIELIKHYWL
ncbi:MAG: YfhO family protein [Clostridia bacterium]|nr:YfhO family protein [Clostridia bacterium]